MPGTDPDHLAPIYLEPDTVRHVASTCLCLHAQRAARALARLFDNALRPLGLTNGQFSLLMALNRSDPPTIGALAPFLAMDRTSLTAALKPLERRGLVRVEAGARDRRSRVVAITPDGVALLRAALPIWRDTHTRLDRALGDGMPDRLREGLRELPYAAAAGADG
ncbi:MarR family winged helix-turn-helix transcriptional regulator [Salinarimonas chemoclinalis]|uniref:MarR family winged helix-turn-helix transcriptional regulator n=1 Tax=Salinarimonas chemoclinalis TaxID=3241599 RepID=UPI003558C726